MDDARFDPAPKTCPVDGCVELLKEPQDILCAGHWAKVPEEQQQAVRTRYRIWRRDNPRFQYRTKNDYTLACNNAIRAAGRADEAEKGTPA